MTLKERVQESDLVNLPDWQVAEILNTADKTLPEIVDIVSVFAGPGTIMQVLGPDAGAAFLDKLEAMAINVPRVKWALHIIKTRGIDVGDSFSRLQIDGLAQAGILTPTQADSIKKIAENRRFPSWAEHNKIEVTARTVGLARGARE